MKNKLYKKAYQEYKKGYSLAEVGKMFGMSRQSVYIGFKRRKYKLRKKTLLPFLTFKGNKYTLRNHGYYARTNGERSLMHRDVWEFYNNKIPRGYDIHHINHNKTDNLIKNLEIYSKSEHAKKFYNGNNQYGKNNRQIKK